MSDVESINKRAALVGVDWGTTSLRLVAIDSHGESIASVDSAQGITRVPDAGFDSALESALSDWGLPVGIPLILSGMIGSRNGWVEAPYIAAPAALSQLASGLVRHRSRVGRELFFVPGVKLSTQGGQADVMRGEETELLGWFEKNPAADERRTFVMPGTHCKWVDALEGSITHFRTCMTGEVFATLCENSILGRLMEPAVQSSGQFQAGAAFTRGATLGLREPQALLANLFTARALPLLELMPSSEVREYLAGLLIGCEISAQTVDVAGPLVVIGRGELAERYVHVLELAGLPAQSAPPGSALSGQLAIARAAGLVSK